MRLTERLSYRAHSTVVLCKRAVGDLSPNEEDTDGRARVTTDEERVLYM